MLEVMTNLSVLAKSELVGPVRDLIDIARGLEEQIRKSRTVETRGGLDGDRRLPMDAIGAQWRLELPFGGSAATAQTKNARRNPASVSKSITSSESPSSNEKTNSETPGSE